MREIKFRVKSIGSNKWLIGSLNPQGQEVNLATFFSQLHTSYWDIETLGQFTSLKDKDGKEYYQKDCLKYGKTIHYIDWNEDESQWWLYWRDGIPSMPFKKAVASASVIIGNKWENPELLKG